MPYVAPITQDELYDAAMIGLVVIAACCAFFFWLADRMDKQDIAQRYPVDEAANLAELEGFAAVRDGASDNLGVKP